jgi:hypothetical protein
MEGSGKRSEQFREVPAERSQLPRDQLDPFAVPKYDAPKTIPLGLKEPSVAVGYGARQLRQHRRQRGLEGKIERVIGR